MSAPVKIVKVKPYPIKAKMTVGAAVVEGQILKLTPTGFLIDAPVPGMKTGIKFQIKFKLPLKDYEIDEACVLVKLYTTMESHVIEGHFQNLGVENEKHLRRFLISIPKATRPPDIK